MKFATTMMTGFMFFAAAPLAYAANDVRILHSVTERTHCYRIINNTGKVLEEISLGFSWAGHPLKDNLMLSVKEQPAGWKVEKRKRGENGFQYFFLQPTQGGGGAGDAGQLCFRLTRNVDGMETLPFSYLLKDDAYRSTGHTTAQ